MTKPRFGWRYASALPGGAAREFLVLTEDLWNDRMGDSVVVPLFDLGESKSSVVRVSVGDGLAADCTRVANVHHDYLGDPVGRCEESELTKVRIGVRVYLDIDRRESGDRVPAIDPRADWWPRQGDFHFAANPAIGPADKLYASVADDDWSSRERATYTAAVRLTSKTKPFRARWEVPIAGSFVVAGDLYLIAYHRFEQTAPPAKYPHRIGDGEMSELARSQKRVLSLS